MMHGILAKFRSAEMQLLLGSLRKEVAFYLQCCDSQEYTGNYYFAELHFICDNRHTNIIFIVCMLYLYVYRFITIKYNECDRVGRSGPAIYLPIVWQLNEHVSV